MGLIDFQNSKFNFINKRIEENFLTRIIQLKRIFWKHIAWTSGMNVPSKESPIPLYRFKSDEKWSNSIGIRIWKLLTEKIFTQPCLFAKPTLNQLTQIHENDTNTIQEKRVSNFRVSINNYRLLIAAIRKVHLQLLK